MAIIMGTKKCTGCRACEIACSYHHRQFFKPSIASIRVKRCDIKGNFAVKLMHYRQAEDGHLACDCSKNQEFCIRYCPVTARDELKALLQSKDDES